MNPEFSGTDEPVQQTLDGLDDTEQIEIHNISASNVAKGLVDTTRENGGVLVMGASRDHIIRQWVFGSTPDRTVDIAEEAGVPVLIYRGPASITRTVENLIFTVYRFATRLTG